MKEFGSGKEGGKLMDEFGSGNKTIADFRFWPALARHL